MRVYTILNADSDVIPKGEQARKYMQGEDYAEDYVVDFKDLQSLNKKFSANKDMKVSVKEQKGFIHNTYTYEMSFPNGLNGTDEKTNIAKKEAVSEKTDTKAVNDFINSVPFVNEATLPGTLLSTNAIERRGNNLVWTYSLGQLTSGEVMKATYTLDNRTNILMLYASGSIAVIVALVGLTIMVRRRRVI